MAKNIHQDTLVNFPLEELMGDRFGKYAKYIIQDRALPDARDGLKPVQRRILYAMYEDGNTWDKPTRKSAKTVGLVIGTYHPHGDTSVYDAMVRMSQSWKMGETLVEMQGNNGSIDDDPAAAMRYTEARLAPISGELLADIDKDTVEHSPNYDDSEMEPTVLPARFPNILVNGASGIAAGYATHIPPHNLNEIVEATIYRIYNPYCTLEDIMQYVKGPDFPTGGIVQGSKGIQDALRTGKGQVIVRSKCEVVETKTMKQIVITEIPYEVVKANMVKNMEEIRLNKVLDGVLAVRDESGRDGLKIVVDIKKDANAELILNYFYKKTELQTSYHYNMVAIVNKTPVRLGLIQLLDAYIQHREEVVLRRTRYDLDKKEKRCHILEGLIKAVSVMDEIIAIIRKSKDKADSKKNLIERFEFSEAQAEAIVTMRLYRLSSTDVKELREEFKVLVNEMEMLQTILNEKKVLDSVIVSELKEINQKYPRPRKTQVEEEVAEITIDRQAMVTSEAVMVAITRDGYVKRVSMRSYNATPDTVCGLKEGDHLLCYQEVDTLDTLLLFTDKGRYAYVPVYEITEAKWKEIGEHLSATVKISGDEKIIGAVVCRDFDTQCYVVSVSKMGMIKRTLISDYVLQRYTKPATAMNLKEGDSLVSVALAYDQDEVVLVSRNGYSVRYILDQISMSGPKSAGVKAMNLSEDEIGSMAVYHGDKAMLVLATTKNQMKRIRMSEIEYYNRPARGELLAKKIKTKPLVFDRVSIQDLSDTVEYVQENKFASLEVKSIPLMDKSATVSSVLKEEEYVLVPLQRALKREKSAVFVVESESGGDIQMSFDIDELIAGDGMDF
ncbi:MAG: DNA topoisomerase IV subunit A [Erysipelotrichales bacterium]|nr:DNA topoisomerase IV subunit A [Erysipelotrichales bacterium]